MCTRPIRHTSHLEFKDIKAFDCSSSCGRNGCLITPFEAQQDFIRRIGIRSRVAAYPDSRMLICYRCQHLRKVALPKLCAKLTTHASWAPAHTEKAYTQT